MSSGYNSFQERLIEESGLSEESADTILEMKSVLSEYRDFKSKQSSAKNTKAVGVGGGKSIRKGR